MNAKVPLWTLALLATCSTVTISQSFDSMPVYKPQQHVSGTIRISGDEHQSVMLRNWERDFHRYQPDILFDDHLTSTVHGIPALVFDVADLALLGRVPLRPAGDHDRHRQLRHSLRSVCPGSVREHRESSISTDVSASCGHLRVRSREKYSHVGSTWANRRMGR